MGELVLTRSADDRRRYDLEGVGSLRRLGLFSRTTLLMPRDGEPLTAQARGVLGDAAEAVSPAGVVVGEFTAQGILRHGGEVSWGGRTLQLRSTGLLASRYSLHDGDVPLLEVEAKGWGRHPARVRLADAPVEPGAVLFVLWLVQGFAERDSGSGAAVVAAT